MIYALKKIKETNSEINFLFDMWIKLPYKSKRRFYTQERFITSSLSWELKYLIEKKGCLDLKYFEAYEIEKYNDNMGVVEKINLKDYIIKKFSKRKNWKITNEKIC